jgi:TrmH family RNA methyltransferase
MASSRTDEREGIGGRPGPLITSFRNPKVKYLRALRLRKYRQREGVFLIEGIRIVEEALDRDAPVEMLIYAPELLVSQRARSLLERMAPDRLLALSGDVFRTLSDREEPQGIAALVRIEDPAGETTSALSSIPVSKGMLVIVACQLRDPGNLGSIIRTADAAGATGLIIMEPSVDLHDPLTIRATMGSLFALPIVRLQQEAALIQWFSAVRAMGVPLLVVASSAHGKMVHFEVDLRQPLVLAIGSERYGLPASLQEGADIVARLPMLGRATSLNVSAATAALVYEAIRQRRDATFPAVGRG